MMAVVALAATALAYPLCLHRDLFLRLEARFAQWGPVWLAFFQSNVRPLLQFGYDPLILKETVGAMAVLLMALGYVPWKLLYSPVRTDKRALHAPLLLFLALAGVSLVWTPSFRSSVMTLEALVPAAVFFLMVSDVDWGEQGRRKLLGALSAIGAVLCVVALFQVVPRLSAFYYRFYYRFDDPRNSMGAWIGHNTELSSYALSSFFAGLALFLTARGLAARVALGVFLALAVFIVIAGQSRAIWPIAIVLGGWAAWRMARELGRRPRAVHFLIVAAVVLALCAPLAPQLRRRIQHYSPQALTAETRLRILAASLSLIAQNPVLGHGIGSFANVYPKAQADYFARRPGSRLAQTDKRTPQAHDDYLQVFIELGIVGLGLVVAGFFLYAREGARGWKALASAPDRVQAMAFACIAAQHGLNALANFPAHVAPSAYLFALALGVWVGLGRETGRVPSAAMRPLPRSSAGRVLLLVAAMAPLVAAPRLWALFARELIVSAHTQMGVGLLLAIDPRSGVSRQERDWAVNGAERHLFCAQRLDPLNWEALFHLAGIYLEVGTDFARAYEQARTEPGAEKQAELFRSLAKQNLKRCLSRLEMSFPEMKFHQSLYTAGQACHALAELEPGGPYQSQAIEYFRSAVRYSGVYYDALRGLTRELASQYALSKEKRPEPAVFVALGRQMRQSDPQRYRRDFIEPLLRRVCLLDFATAVLGLQNAILIDPDDRLLRFNRVVCLVEMGQMERAAQEVVDMEARLGRPPEYWDAMAAFRMADGRCDEALAIALENGAVGERPNSWLAMAASLLLRRQGREAEAESVWAGAETDPQAKAFLQSWRAYFAYSFLRSPELALADAEQLASREDCPPLALYVRGRIAFDRGDCASALADARRAIESGFNGGAARQLEQMAAEALNPARSPLEAPVSQPAEPQF